MLKSTNLILLLFCTLGSFAQTERIKISGKIVSIEKDLKGIHVINKATQEGTITDSDGSFYILAQPMDTLFFKGIQFDYKEVIITQIEVTNKSIEVELIIKTNKLKEVYLVKPENMAMALNLPNADKKPLKGVDLKLAYYSQESTPVVIFKALLGEQGGIENIYNIISGNRKKHRKLKKLIEDDKAKELNKLKFKEIRTHFKDDFFIYTLKIKNIDNFIEFCLPENIIYLFSKNRFLEVTDVFIKQSKMYRK